MNFSKEHRWMATAIQHDISRAVGGIKGEEEWSQMAWATHLENKATDGRTRRLVMEAVSLAASSCELLATSASGRARSRCRAPLGKQGQTEDALTPVSPGSQQGTP